jgi:hypothetical protein
LPYLDIFCHELVTYKGVNKFTNTVFTKKAFLDGSISASFSDIFFLKCPFTLMLMTMFKSSSVMSYAHFFDVDLAKDSLCVLLLVAHLDFMRICILGAVGACEGLLLEGVGLLGGKLGGARLLESLAVREPHQQVKLLSIE